MSDKEDQNNKITAEQQAEEDRRQRKKDRRQKEPTFNEQGHIVSPNYTGPDRRSGVDRREHRRQVQKKVNDEKKKFLWRSIISVVFISIGVIYAGIFLMAPEYLSLQEKASRIETLEQQIQQMDQHLKSIKAEKKASFSGKINKVIEDIEQSKTTVTDTVADTVEKAVKNGAHLSATVSQFDSMKELIQVLSNVVQMSRSAEGKGDLSHAMEKIKFILKQTGDDSETAIQSLDNARQKDPKVAALIGHVRTEDLKAAALLLALNEFRSDVHTGQSFEEDLALLQQFSNNDPALQKSLSRLTPYAKTGVLSQDTLKTEFKGIAGDIVMAKLKGEDANVQEKVLSRISKLVKVRKIDDVKGNTTDAIVARAQIMLDKGDVRGAMAELQKLEGEPAKAAAPWMEAAAGNIMAEDSSMALMQTVLQNVSQEAGFSIENIFSNLLNQLHGGASSVYLSPSMQHTTTK